MHEARPHLSARPSLLGPNALAWTLALSNLVLASTQFADRTPPTATQCHRALGERPLGSPALRGCLDRRVMSVARHSGVFGSGFRVLQGFGLRFARRRVVPVRTRTICLSHGTPDASPTPSYSLRQKPIVIDLPRRGFASGFFCLRIPENQGERLRWLAQKLRPSNSMHTPAPSPVSRLAMQCPESARRPAPPARRIASDSDGLSP